MSARNRSRSRHSIRRSTGTRKPNTTFALYIEGEKTEPEYIEMLKSNNLVPDSVSIHIKKRGAQPNILVTQALKDHRSGNRDYDQYWCIYDVEYPQQHSDLEKLQKDTQATNICHAISNPCFELWLILHFEDCASLLTTKEAGSRKQMLDSVSKHKSISAKEYANRVDDAIKRARKLEERHRLDGRVFPHNNPSSNFYNFIEALRATKQLDS